MERVIEGVVDYAGFIVPLLALWAIAALYSLRTGCQCIATQLLFFSVMLLISGITVRTVMSDDGCWLVHTASLGMMVVAGVMRRPEVESPEFATDSFPL
jgi:hypothetical protein